MSFASMHNDYLDPDRHAPPEPPEWWDVMEENCREFMAQFSSTDWYGFYRPVYKGTDCGPTVGVRVYGADSPVYCDDLRKVPADAPVLQVHVSSIVEGSNAVTETHVIDMKVEGALKRFWEALESVNAEACDLWDEANGSDEE